jgi:transcriptional regulator with PAS, ATPase and Fis domain
LTGKPDEAACRMIGSSSAMQKIIALIDKVKNISTPVFIGGESGTGKELVARNIHHLGCRRCGPFVALNCGAIPENLLESELFGYAKGAYTGACRDRKGLVEEAHRGSLFLDEIGDLSPHLQAKLLRLLQEREIRRIGENQRRRVNVRFISATNKCIEQEVEAGRFREDLYYRLKIISIELPPLRERRSDIRELADYYLDKYSRECGCPRMSLSYQALAVLSAYSWPGNVRELQNEIQRCLVFLGDRNQIEVNHLSSRIKKTVDREIPSKKDFFQARNEFEKIYVHQALARCNYNRSQTAEEIGISRQGLFKLIKKHQIEIPSHG